MLFGIALLLGGCDQLGIEAASAVAAKREGEGKAVGGACRHAGRAIEDCYSLNKKADKAAVFAGWREMNDYMRENKIETVAPQSGGEKSDSAHESSDKAADKPAEKATEKAAVKGGDKPANVERVAKK